MKLEINKKQENKMEISEVNKNDCDMLFIRLSNGDDVVIYDSKDFYSSIMISRHEYNEGKASEIESKSNRPKKLPRSLRKNGYSRTKKMALRGFSDAKPLTNIEVTRFYNKNN